MRKQVAIVIDASGSMYHPAGNDCQHDKIVEASESVKWMLDEIKTLVRNNGDEWAVSLWYFASTFSGLVGQTMFDIGIQDFTVNIMKDVVTAVEDQASTQAAIGSLTDIFGAVRQTSDWMEALPPTWPSFPGNGPPDKRVIFFFTDGQQTINHNGALNRAGYEAEQGVSFLNLLQGRNIILKAQGIGSDLLNATLTDLSALGAAGSNSKVISETPGYSTDCSPALMTNALKAVNDNGVLPLRPVGGAASGLLWEQFSLPTAELVPVEGILVAAAFHGRRVNQKDFEVDVDGVSRELILGLTWHQAGSPSIDATSPSGLFVAPAVAGAYLIQEGWMFALHIPNPEAGTWRVRVHGDPRQSPIRLNLMARGVNRRFDLRVHANPTSLATPGKAKIVVEPLLDDKPASGKLQATATVFGGETVALAGQHDGTFSGGVEITRLGVSPVRVELKGTLDNGASIGRIEFTTVQVGRPRDPRLSVSPDRYVQGQAYSVEVAIRDAAFNRVTSIRFGTGIAVRQFTVLSADRARAEIEVSRTAMVGSREVVTFSPDAETLSGIEVAAGDKSRPGGGSRICCLKFDSAGALVGVVLCDGKEICVKLHDDRLQRLLETARDRNLSVTIRVDSEGCLTGFDVCR